jgi:hypothetical protein
MKPMKSLLLCTFRAPMHALGRNQEVARSKRSFIFRMLALCLCSVPATANMLYTNLGTGGTYDNTTFWNVCGDGGCGSMTIATQFSIAGSDSQSVTAIDLAVGNVLPPATLFAAIFTDNDGTPGTQVTNAYWNLSTSTNVGDLCCALDSITGITGVTLSASQLYYLILGPLDTADSSWNGWFYNSQGVNGLVLSSLDGGASWAYANGMSSSPLGAFDIVGTQNLVGTLSQVPEPVSLLLFGTGLIGILATQRRRQIANRLD